jgi:hypothetical protein
MTMRPPWTTEDLGAMPRMLPNRVAQGLRPTLPPGLCTYLTLSSVDAHI